MIDLTKKDVELLSKDIGETIAKESVIKYTVDNWITESEANSLEKIIEVTASKKICDIIGGYVS